MSLQASGTKSLILSYRYFCLSGERPGGLITSGSWFAQGCQFWWFLFRIVTVLSSASHRTFTTTFPGVADEKIRWCKVVIPSKAPLLK